MIIVLHGDDQTLSYGYLSKIQNEFANSLKVRLPTKATEQDLAQAVLTTDLINSDKLIIAESFLSPFKLLPKKLLENIPENVNIIFWEKTILSPAKVTYLSKIARVEFFKQKSDLFAFLDLLTPGAKNAFKMLATLPDEPGLIWHLQSRFLLLALSKFNVTADVAIKITKRNIFDWQWQKVKFQAAKFEPHTILAVYNASLKIDQIIKSGKTTMPQKTLISMLILKYL